MPVQTAAQIADEIGLLKSKIASQKQVVERCCGNGVVIGAAQHELKVLGARLILLESQLLKAKGQTLTSIPIA